MSIKIDPPQLPWMPPPCPTHPRAGKTKKTTLLTFFLTIFETPLACSRIGFRPPARNIEKKEKKEKYRNGLPQKIGKIIRWKIGKMARKQGFGAIFLFFGFFSPIFWEAVSHSFPIVFPFSGLLTYFLTYFNTLGVSGALGCEGFFRHRRPDPTLESTSPSPPQRSVWHQSGVKSGNRCRINVESTPNLDTEYDRVKVPPYNGNGPRPPLVI